MLLYRLLLFALYLLHSALTPNSIIWTSHKANEYKKYTTYTEFYYVFLFLPFLSLSFVIQLLLTFLFTRRERQILFSHFGVIKAELHGDLNWLKRSHTKKWMYEYNKIYATSSFSFLSISLSCFLLQCFKDMHTHAHGVKSISNLNARSTRECAWWNSRPTICCFYFISLWNCTQHTMVCLCVLVNFFSSSSLALFMSV